MTKTTLRTIGLVAALVAGSLGSTAPASAGNGGFSVGVVIGDGGGRHHGDRHFRRGGGRGGDFCAAPRALREASRLGVRRPYVARETRRAITVASARNGAVVRFAQRRDCPVISYRR